jgi:hypothetical protein
MPIEMTMIQSRALWGIIRRCGLDPRAGYPVHRRSSPLAFRSSFSIHLLPVMKHVRLALGALALLLAASSCSQLNVALVQHLTGDPPMQESLMRLGEVRSVEEIDAALERIVPGNEGQHNVEVMFEGWGKHGSWYDLAVNRYIFSHWPSAYRKKWNHIDSRPLAAIIERRLNEQPDLLRQFYWYAQWERGGMPFDRLCSLCLSQPAKSARHDGQDFPLLLVVASSLNDCQIVYDCNVEHVSDSWYFTQLEFLARRAFLRFDKDQGVFAYDADAMRANRYMKPEEQQTILPLTPLPNWDNNVLPPSPSADGASSIEEMIHMNAEG